MQTLISTSTMYGFPTFMYMFFHGYTLVLLEVTLKLVKAQDMIYVVESKPAKRYGDFFLRQIAKVN